MRDIVTLACSKCKRRNYTTTKNKKKHSDRLVHIWALDAATVGCMVE